jgi:uncharacterized cupin superfamily protein
MSGRGIEAPTGEPSLTVGTAVSSQSLSAPEDFPLDNVIDGNPQAQVQWLGNQLPAAGTLFVGIFSCQPCTVETEYVGGECSYLLEGRMTVQIKGGQTVSLKAGDTASFAPGTKAICQVHEPIRQFFVISG